MLDKNKLFSVVEVTIGAKNGKMNGIASVNTSTLKNDYCIKMIDNKNAVCGSCYAKTYEKMRPTLRIKLERNSALLSEKLLDSQLPRFNAQFVRFDSFGELINEQHFLNLVRICELNPLTTFTLWTKRLDIVLKLLDCKVIEKPNNMILIYSSPALNNQATLPRHFDKVFTVFDKKTALTENVNVNCGKRKCFDCRVCYTKNDITIINELEK